MLKEYASYTNSNGMHMPLPPTLVLKVSGWYNVSDPRKSSVALTSRQMRHALKYQAPIFPWLIAPRPSLRVLEANIVWILTLSA